MPDEELFDLIAEAVGPALAEDTYEQLKGRLHLGSLDRDTILEEVYAVMARRGFSKHQVDVAYNLDHSRSG